MLNATCWTMQHLDPCSEKLCMHISADHCRADERHLYREFLAAFLKPGNKDAFFTARLIPAGEYHELTAAHSCLPLM